MLVRNASDAANLLRPLVAGSQTEMLALAYLDATGRVLKITKRQGGADLVELSLRDVVAEGLELGACALVLAHNHPSGDPKASQADVAVTRRLAEVCEAVGIGVYDHLVFGGTRRISMRAAGLL
jgi:DNA repair protein RadC